tara:strand:- start:182 stop:1798 length:1617 start_codon:yes stop_codon:yes gene_type:complete
MNYKDLIESGINLARNGNFIEAENYFKKAIEKDSIIADSYINLANIYIMQKRIEEGINLLKTYLIDISFNQNIISHFWKISQNFNRDENFFETISSFEDSKALNKKDLAYIYYLLGRYYARANKIETSIKYFKKSIFFDQLLTDSYINLIDWLERINEISQANFYLNKFSSVVKKIDYKIKFFEALLLSREKKYKASENILNKYELEKYFEKNKYYYIRLLNLKSKNNERLKNFSIAYNSIVKRNLFLSSLEENQKIDKGDIDQTIQNYKEVFSKENKNVDINELKIGKKIDLTFLIGFPRSGTTLLDTILRTHSKTLVLEEKLYLENTRNHYFTSKDNNLNAIKNISLEEIINLRKYYFDQINVDYKNIVNVIDKLPLTITELGFVKKIFPDAKIILALRHPCDVVISCFFSSFKMNRAMINFLSVKNTVDFYNKVLDLFEFYENELNLEIIKIKYEDIVLNFEKETKKLFKFLNLDYEKGINKFYETAQNRKMISTPSYSQVTNPIYSSSIGRWKNYESLVKIEKPLKKWIQKLNY